MVPFYLQKMRFWRSCLGAFPSLPVHIITYTEVMREESFLVPAAATSRRGVLGFPHGLWQERTPGFDHRFALCPPATVS